jgi:capsular polysaccharide biosynthesis protein
MTNFSSFLQKKLKALVLCGLLVSATAFLILILVSKKYDVKTDFLVTQSSRDFRDFYSVAKSSEYLSRILSQSVYSDRFIEEVVQTGKVDKNFLPIEQNERIKVWEKTIKVNTKRSDVGIVGIEILHNDKREAMKISQAVGQVMMERNHLFRGGGEHDASVTVFSGPILESNPTLSKVLGVIISGFLAGFFGALVWVIARYDEFWKYIFDEKYD